MHSQKSLPSLKRKQKVLPLHERVALERVLGFTVNNSCGLATDPNTGQIAYPAGCVVVLYNPRRNKQTHLVNTSKKAITCLAFSKDGRYLATGESGHQPSVRLWDLEEMTQIAEFQGHKFGINAVIFSPNQKNLISVGSQYDMMVNVWNWRTQCKVASNKVAAKVTGIAFSEDSSTFVTVGNRHVKFWNMDSSKSRIKETVPLKGHSGILGEQKNNFFCGVCCGCGATANKTYAITRSGLLCEFNDNRLLDKWVELRTTSATCIVAQEHHVFVGCANGIVRVFNAGSLNYVTTLPRPHHLGVDVTSGQDPSSVTSAPADAVYPDTVAISIDDEACKLTCIYNDHSLYIWDIHDIKRIGKCRSFLYHSAAIWGVEVYPLLEQGVDLLPRGSFFTCSSDDTIRIWNVDPHMSTDTPYKRNIYSNELLKVIYTDQDLCNIVEKEFNPAGKTDKTDTQYQDNHGVRSLTVSNDGKHLASGDREGNIRIHELKFMEELHTLEAHDSEVLSLEFSQPSLGKNILASTSRDRLIHVFDCDNDYELLQTLDDHSAAITSVKFYENENHQLGMLSCGMDKSLLFRGAQMEPEFQFVMTRHLVGKTTLYDMCLDPRQKFVATACQDRNIRIYNLKNGKYKKSYSGSTGSDGTLLRLAQDRSGAYVVASCSDKNVGIFDFFTGECMANMLGHSEVVTGIRFTNDMKHIISVSGDGCIFIWRLPYDMTEQMCKRLMETTGSVTNSNLTNRNDTYLNEDDFLPATSVIDNLLTTPDKNANLLTDPGSQHKPDFRFSVGQLPSWAKRQVLQDTGNIQTTSEQPTMAPPSGRWAQRAIVKSVLPDGITDRATNLPMGPLHVDRTDNSKYLVETIIVDDECEDDDDDEDFKQFGPHKTLNQNKVPFDQTLPLEDDEEDEDDSMPSNDVVFFPPKEEEEGSDTTAKSYRVFEGDVASVAESDGTEQSVDSDEEETCKTADSSMPSTPDMDHFILNQISLEDGTEEKFDQVIPDVPQPPNESTTRLSMSTRFLSLSQQPNLRHSNKSQPPTLQDRKQMMAQAVMETRKRLQAVPRDSRVKQVSKDQMTKDSPYSAVSTSLTRSHSQHEVHSDSHDSTSTDNSTDLTFTESNADVTATTTTGDKNKAVGRKGHSYQSATKSSKAKSRFSTGNVKDLSGAGIGSSSRKSFGSKALSAGLKNKFKSTPDLMTIGDTNKENDGLSSSKTTEDLSDGEHLAEKDDQFLHTTQAQCNWKSPLLSAVATSCQGSASPTLSSSSGYMSATSSVTSKAGPAVPGTQPATTTSMASISSMVSVDDGDAGLMPPPPTTNVVTSRHAKSGGQSNGRRSTMTDLTLQQAKQILLGHPVTSDAAPNSSSSVRRRSTANEGTPSMLTKQRPHSALSGMMTATTPGPTTGSALSSQLEVKPMPRTMPTAISTSSFRMMLNSATLKSGAAVGTTASRDSMTVGHNDYLDDLPEKDTDSSTSSTKLSDEPVSMQNKTDLTATAATVISTIGTQKSPVGISQSSVLQSKPGEWDTKAKYEVKLTSSQEVRSRLTTSRVVGMSQSDTLNLVCMSDVVPGVKHDVPQGRSEMRKDEVKMEDDDSVTNSSKGVVDVTPPKCTESSNVGLARHRTPHVYNRTCMSPARQVINTNVGMQGHGMASAIRPPSIPAPLVPPRELASHSGSVVSPQRTLVQVNRDRQQVTPPRLVNHDAAPTTRIPALGEQELRQSSAFLSGSNILDPEANIFSPGGDEPGDDPDLEVKRPDKTQSSPPASLIADVTKDVTPSCVILTPPSTSQGGPGSHSGSVVGDFNLAFHRILAAYNAASQEAGSSSDSEEVKALRETLEQAQSDLIKVLGPPQPDFTPYLSQKDQNTTPPSTLTNRSTGPLRLRSDLANTEILNMLDYYSVHLCHLFKQKLDKSEGKE